MVTYWRTPTIDLYRVWSSKAIEPSWVRGREDIIGVGCGFALRILACWRSSLIYLDCDRWSPPLNVHIASMPRKWCNESRSFKAKKLFKEKIAKVIAADEDPVIILSFTHISMNIVISFANFVKWEGSLLVAEKSILSRV